MVLRKEARAKKEVVDIADAFISIIGQSTRLSAPNVVHGPRNTNSLIGAIELSLEETLLAIIGY